MFRVMKISFVYSESNWHIDRICEFTDTDCYLFFIRSVIATISVFSKLAFVSKQNKARPIKIYVSVVKIICLEQAVLDVGNYFFPIFAYIFKGSEKCSFFEFSKIKSLKDFVAIYPFTGFAYAEILS